MNFYSIVDHSEREEGDKPKNEATRCHTCPLGPSRRCAGRRLEREGVGGEGRGGRDTSLLHRATENNLHW